MDNWKNPYFDIEIAKKVQRRDKTIGGYLFALCKFGVCAGVDISPSTITKVLTEENIPHSSNKRGIIWLPTVGENLIKIFQKS